MTNVSDSRDRALRIAVPIEELEQCLTMLRNAEQLDTSALDQINYTIAALNAFRIELRRKLVEDSSSQDRGR
jgi:hypothetical protein